MTIYGDFSSWERCPIVSLNLGNWDSAAVGGPALPALWHRHPFRAPLRPLAHRALGTERQGGGPFSFSHFNTQRRLTKESRPCVPWPRSNLCVKKRKTDSHLSHRRRRHGHGAPGQVLGTPGGSFPPRPWSPPTAGWPGWPRRRPKLR